MLTTLSAHGVFGTPWVVRKLHGTLSENIAQEENKKNTKKHKKRRSKNTRLKRM